MLMLLLAVTVGCTATTNIPEFEDIIKHACESPGADKLIKNVDFSGTHEEATFTITYAKEHKYLSVPDTELGRIARESAMVSNQILRKLYPMKLLNYALREPDGSPICDFQFNAIDEKPIKSTCQGLVQ